MGADGERSLVTAGCPEACDPVLQVRDLAVTLGNEAILQGVSLDVGRGHLHAVLGPNGAGKTSFMRSLVGGMPHRGRIEFRFVADGRLGYVPQLLDFDHQLPMTVMDFLTVAAGSRPAFLGRSRTTRAQLAGALARTQCEHLSHRFMGSLSGGELRRVLLAQALTPTPEVLLLDEPLSNVDRRAGHELEALLRELRDHLQLSIIVIGHEVDRLLEVADEVTVLNRRVRYSGSSGQRDVIRRALQDAGVGAEPASCGLATPIEVSG